MHCASAEFAAQKVAEGFDLVMLTSDVACLARAAAEQLSLLRSSVAGAAAAG
jgi:hypothetical protein